MFTVRRILSPQSPNTVSVVCDKKIVKGRISNRRYGQRVPEHLLINEEDKEKYKLDPRVRELTRQIIHSDYLESKSLRFGREKNGRILRAMSKKVNEAKLKRLMETPATSVLSKYLRESDVSSSSSKNLPTKENESSLSSSKSKHRPVSMPYAVTDRYERTIAAEDEAAEEKEVAAAVGNEISSDLNKKYVKLYEKYLTEKVTTTSSDDASKDVPVDWMTDYEQYDDDDSTTTNLSAVSRYGTPDPNYPIGTIPCGGCGALLHCQDPAIPGYLPSELFKYQADDILRSSVCQRCHFMKQYNTLLNVTVSADEYPALLRHIRKEKVAVIMMIDLTDFPCSVWPGVTDIVHKSTQIYVVGNKVDLLPNDGPDFLKNVEKSLLKTLKDMGIDGLNIKSVDLISAKTGYGVERLINKLHKNWGYKGDVYVIGCTNVGKSSLFNTLLRSDYCKIQATNFIQRATISHWPGTTLNLLKFPILNPVRWRLWMRTRRLLAEKQNRLDETEYRSEMFKDTNKLKYATLRDTVGQSFASNLLVEGPGYIGHIVPYALNETGRLGLNEGSEIYRSSRWCYDTPGALLPDQVLHFLTTQELMSTLPRSIISPRSFVLYKSQTLLLAGLGRLDFLDGHYNIACTVFASQKLPVTICRTENADELYEKLLKTDALVVPSNDPERLKLFPRLESKNFEITGIGRKQSVADVVLSSAGWIALTLAQEKKIQIRAWTPEGRGIYLRTPALLSRSVKLCGYRIPNSQVFARGKRVYMKK